MENKTLSVSKFVEYINQTLSTFSTVLVEGEVSDFSINRNQWVSFDLKDEEDEQILPCFTSYGLFKSMGLDESLEDGMRVKVRGDVKVRDKGHFSMFMKKIQLAGEGTLKKAYQKLKKKLQEEGYFAESRKRELPRFPQKICVITSDEAKAYSDFLKVLENRMGGIEIYHSEVHVQGENAVPDITKAFQNLNKKQQELNLDLIVLTRGGGSLEDLQAFNSKEVAKAVFSSKIPVVCGVGHEDDVTLAGLTSDLRASTPSNAAELIVEEDRKLLEEIDTNIFKIQQNLTELLNDKGDKLNNFIRAGSNFVKNKQQKLEQISLKLNHNLNKTKEEIFRKKEDVDELIQSCEKKLASFIKNKRTRLKHHKQLLKSYSPSSVLDRGYSVVKKDQEIVNSTQKIAVEDKVNITLSDGDFNSQVTNINN
jgi:exodeoxyribonuclease VII large subunit